MGEADNNSRLYRIFRELQEKGLIGRRRRLVECPFIFSMQGCPALNCIRYRRAFYDRYLSRASDDTLRFVLLHEEGHIRKGSPLLSVLPALPVLPYLLLLRYPPIDSLLPVVLPSLQAGGLPIAKLASIALLLLTVVFAYRAYYRRAYDEEFTADRYAAEVMKLCYRVRDPGALLQNLLSGLRTAASASRSRRSGHLYQVIPGFIRSEPDYRPSISERVQRVREATGPGGENSSVRHGGSSLSR
ncbi:MAG: M48 family metalloprotease [Methanoculleus sp.]|nr:M48 family metalloprotease [Methanoculleus sp.]